MNQNGPQPSFELPSLPNEGVPSSGSAPEQNPAAPERLSQPSGPAVPMMPPQSIPQASSSPTNTPTGQPMQPISATPQIADDNDLIEKEWVLKAKQIVAATKDDPYVQNREINKFKADYLKKRYNKDLKIEES